MQKTISELFSLDGKVAIVTAGAGWLGSAMSQALAESGAKVAIVDINQEATDELVNELKAKGLKAAGFITDIMSDKPLRHCIDDIAAEYGRLDILIHGAFPFGAYSLEEITAEQLDKGFHNGSATNMIAAQQAAIHMRKVGGGSIINIASMYVIVSHCPDVYENISKPLDVTYTAGKVAIIHMTRHMAVYWAKDNIRVNCISPGPFPQRDTPKRMPELVERISRKVPMGRFGQPWELKGATVFLAPEASSFMTSQNIFIDGSWTIW